MRDLFSFLNLFLIYINFFNSEECADIFYFNSLIKLIEDPLLQIKVFKNNLTKVNLISLKLGDVEFAYKLIAKLFL